MRLRARESKARVTVSRQDSLRPIRVHAGSLTFCMDTTEAMELVNELADAITDITQRKDTP